MAFSSLLVFAGVYLAATASPGPGIAALVARVIGHGFQGIVPFIAGFIVGDLIWFCVAATGLAVLAQEFAGLFILIRLCGVLYLLYLAWSLWRAPAHATEIAPAANVASGWRLFIGTLSLTLGNPKVIVFFLSIMPLVVNLGSLDVLVLMEIMAVSAAILTTVLFAYAFAADRARRLLASSRAMQLARRGAATVMAGAAVAIATR